MHIGAGLLTIATSDVCSIATLSNGKDIQQTVVKKTGWQRFEAISLWQVDFCLTLGASQFSMSLAHSCVFSQTLTTKRVKTRYNFRFFEGLETNRANNLFGEVSQEGLHCLYLTRIFCKHSLKELLVEFTRKHSVRVGAR